MFNDLFIIIIILAIIVTLFRSRYAKGAIGEFIVNFLSSVMLDKDKYTLIRNVTLPTEDGGSTQIDLIIVSQYGIFVIETKNMKGWIFGGERQRTWTQIIYKKKSKFQNPLHQNHKHVKTLERLLSLPPGGFFSVVVFMGGCTFKTEMPESVVYPMGYIRYVKSKIVPLLKEEQVLEAVESIQNSRFKKSLKTNINHVRHVKKIVKEKGTRCPKCGSELVERVAMKGPNAGNKFLGCSGFPKCKYTVKT